MSSSDSARPWRRSSARILRTLRLPATTGSTPAASSSGCAPTCSARTV
ncbi:hypothetical protein ACFQV2_00630 [Actinokineospora soli]|uniref:Uncharacterized protein n=1 Tax=Actinokineospora soli TaxID=1048753 RepID=A0ABW2THT6_9PSEU